MELGNKIYELRKNANLSQEQLAEKINVTRQTISNWELGQTTPDILQAKEIAKIFNVSLDELVNNELKDIFIERLSNTEKLVANALKILKFLCVLIICFLIIIISINITLLIRNKEENKKYLDIQNQQRIKEQEYTKYRESLITKKFKCTLNQQLYEYSIQYDSDNIPINFTLSALSLEPNESLFYTLYNYLEKAYSNHTNVVELIKEVEQYFKNNNGTWKEIFY